MKIDKLLFFLPFLAVDLYAEMFTLPRPRGLNTDDAAIFVQDGQATDEQNTVTDGQVGLTGRKGFISFSTEPNRNMWVFNHSNGNSYFIGQSSGTLKATLGGGNFNIYIGTVDSGVRTDGTQYGNRFYYINRTDGLKYWDSAAVVVSTLGMRGDQVKTFNGRLYVSGRDDDPRTIYASEYLNPDNFALAVTPTEASPARIQVQGSLDERITTLYSSFQGKLLWFKARSFGKIDGIRRSQFSASQISDVIGTAYPEYIKDCDGVLRFLGPQSKVYEYDGANIIPLTNDIDDFMSTISQGDPTGKSWAQTTAADFGAGTLTANTLAPGSISTTVVSGSLTFIPFAVPTDDFEDNDLTNAPVWRNMQGGSSCTAINGQLNCPGDNNLITSSSTVSVGTWTFIVAKSSWTSINYLYFMSNSTNPTGTGSIFSRVFVPASGSGQFTVTSGNTEIVLFNCSSTTTSGLVPVVVSRDNSGNFVLNIGTGSAQTRCGSGSNTDITESSYISVLAPAGLMVLESVAVTTLNYVRSSTFTSQSFNIGPNITSWGAFNATIRQPSGASAISFFIFTDTDSSLNITNSTTYTSSQAVASGAIPTIGTAAYVAVVATFSTVTSSPTLPTLYVDNFTVNWNEGSIGGRGASLYFDQRYWVSVAVSSASNNRFLVYDRQRDWHRYVGMPALAAITYNSRAYFGNEGGVFQAETGADDDGIAIAAVFQTKAYWMGNLNRRKTFEEFYVTTTNSAETLQTQYYVDGMGISTLIQMATNQIRILGG